MKRKQNNMAGFTLVELLTTLAVIGILLGLLVPALNQVSKTATRVKQKAQFHAIGIALEAFRNDDGDYPRSEWDTTNYGNYSASQRLAEAIVGRDGLGFHPSSRFNEDGQDALGNALYAPAAAVNVAERKGPYLELESANAVLLPNIPSLSSGLTDSYVLVDMYKINKNTATAKEVGMPILYYKANKMRIGNSSAQADWDTINTYSLNDSYCGGGGFIASGGHFNGNVVNNASNFYNAIANPNFTSPPRPYRSESFILHSAGPDGLYGTTDDMFNFDTEN